MSKIFTMSVASVHVHYVNKVERKGRTTAELDEVIRWLTGFDQEQLQRQIRSMDKLVDEFAKGKAMHKVLRTPAA